MPALTIWTTNAHTKTSSPMDSSRRLSALASSFPQSPEKKGGIVAITIATSNTLEVADLTIPGAAAMTAAQSVTPLHCPLSESRC